MMFTSCCVDGVIKDRSKVEKTVTLKGEFLQQLRQVSNDASITDPFSDVEDAYVFQSKCILLRWLHGHGYLRGWKTRLQALEYSVS